jgi:gamma-tubulin complex component 2
MSRPLILPTLNQPCSDPTANHIFSTLLLHASQPYAEMLIDWISSGHLTDKYEEFMVKETLSYTKKKLEQDFIDDYWDKRYTVRPPSRDPIWSCTRVI